MNEVFRLFGSVGLKTNDAEKGLDNITNKAKQTGAKLNNLGDSMASVGKKMTAGITVPVAAAVGASVKSYADLEQAVGGIETMFGKSANTVIKNSETAYKRAGVSGVDYMEQVTSFSATLLQGLGGDTVAAASYADTAMVDMADNANKFGTDIGSIQDAYQGFAKDNYTMLDNLKLGYGGTAGEMARLINESGVLGDTMEVTAETVNDVPFHLMVEAIHEVQTEMGVTGTTALEAEETVSGSFGSMMASLKDLAAGFGQENANMEQLMSNFSTSVSTFVNNIKRVLGNMWDNLPLAEWQKWIGLIIVAAGPLLTVFGSVIGGVGKLVIAVSGAGSVLGGLVQLFPGVSAGLGLLGKAFSFMTGPIGIAIGAVGAIIGVLIYLYKTNDQVKNAIDTAWNFIKETIMTIAQSISDFVTQLGSVFVSWWQENQETIKTATTNVWNFIKGFIEGMMILIVPIVTIAWTIIREVTQAVWQAIKGIVEAAINLILSIITIIMAVIAGDWSAVWEGIKGVASAIWQAIITIIEFSINTVGRVVEMVLTAIHAVWIAIWNAIKIIAVNIWNDIKSAVSSAINAVRTVISNVMSSIQSAWTSVWNAIKSVAQTIWDTIKSVISNAINNVKSIISSILNGIKSIWSSGWNSIKTVVQTIWNGIKSLISAAFNNVRSTISRVLNSIKSIWSGGWNTIKSTVQRVWDDIKSSISNAINGAVTAVRNGVSKLKSAMNFKWSLPKLKLPRVIISGKFSLNPPSVPKFGVQWFKDGGILTKATAFGMNGNDFMVGGEVGKEAVLPLNRETLGGIGEGIASAVGWTDDGIANSLEDIKALLVELLGQDETIVVQVDGRTIARVTRDPMDRELGTKNRDKNNAKGRR